MKPTAKQKITFVSPPYKTNSLLKIHRHITVLAFIYYLYIDRRSKKKSLTRPLLLRVYHEIFSEYTRWLNAYTRDTAVSFSHEHGKRKTVEKVYRAVFRTINNVTTLTTIIYALYCIGIRLSVLFTEPACTPITRIYYYCQSSACRRRRNVRVFYSNCRC